MWHMRSVCFACGFVRPWITYNTVSNRDEAYVPGHTVALSYNTKACEVFIYLNVLATRSCVRFTLNPHTASPLYYSGVRGILK